VHDVRETVAAARLLSSVGGGSGGMRPAGPA